MINVFKVETLQFLRDKATLIMCFVFPLALIFFLGSFLEKVDMAEYAIGEIKAEYYYDDDLSAQNTMAADSFLSGVKDNGVLTLSKAANIESAKNKVKTHDIAVLIVFRGENLQIQVFEGSDSTANEVVDSVMNGYIQSNKAVMSVVRYDYTKLDSQKTSTQQSYTKEKEFGKRRTMMDYYAVTMLFLMAYMNMQGGSSTFSGDAKQKVVSRLKICSQSRLSIYLGKLLGQLGAIVSQGVLIMIVSVVVFHASYGTTVMSWITVCIMFIALSTATTLLGIVLGQIKAGRFVTPVTVLFWVMMFFSGTMSSQLVIPGVSEYLAPYVIQEAAFDLTVFGRYGQALTVIGVCVLISVIELIVGLKLFSKMEDER